MLWSFGEGLYDTSYFPICTYSFLWRTVPQKEPLRVLDCGFLTVFQIGLDSDTYKLNTIYIYEIQNTAPFCSSHAHKDLLMGRSILPLEKSY